MKKFLFTLAFMLPLVANAQVDGGLNDKALLEIRKGYTASPTDKALRNAINNTAIFTLAQDADRAAMIDTHFSDEVKTKGRTNQKSSGRCWLFTGLNVMRAKMIDKYNLSSFTFSQNYVFFYDQLEKSNLFLQGIIDTRKLKVSDRQVRWLLSNPIGDGGQFTGVANLVEKYGLVPSDIMPETYASNNTSQMNFLLKTLLRKSAIELRAIYEKALGSKSKLSKKEEKTILEKMNLAKIEVLKKVYRILSLSLGVPPTNFEYSLYDSNNKLISTEKYTPQSFYKKYVSADLENNYIMLMNDPSREYNKVYEIDYDRHVYDGQNWLYLNLPIEDIKEMAIASIKDNTAMYFSCDVGKFLDSKKGVLDIANYDYNDLMGVNFDMPKKDRIESLASGSSHAMTLIAVDIKDGKPTKWMVENSWGETNGYKGNLIMTDEWFDGYMFRLVVDKKYASEKIMKLLQQKAIMLPAWDPMFKSEN